MAGKVIEIQNKMIGINLIGKQKIIICMSIIQIFLGNRSSKKINLFTSSESEIIIMISGGRKLSDETAVDRSHNCCRW